MSALQRFQSVLGHRNSLVGGNGKLTSHIAWKTWDSHWNSESAESHKTTTIRRLSFFQAKPRWRDWEIWQKVYNHNLCSCMWTVVPVEGRYCDILLLSNHKWLVNCYHQIGSCLFKNMKLRPRIDPGMWVLGLLCGRLHCPSSAMKQVSFCSAVLLGSRLAQYWFPACSG